MTRLNRRAAGTLWAIGLLQLLLAGCCFGGAVSLMVTPTEQLQQLAAQQRMAPELVAQLQQMAVPIMVIIALLGFLPAIGYLILGFGVRSGRRGAATLAALVCMTQAIVLGVLLLLNLIEALRAGNPASLTVNLLTFGTMLGLLIYAIRLLWTVRSRPVDDVLTDPWNQPDRD